LSRPPWARLALFLVLAAALYFAVQGGEYSTADIARQFVAKRRMRAEVDSLQRMVDSLTRELEAIESDPAVQERIAREEFGMVRGDKELLYRFAEPDSLRR
jgi:cell division protein FtsB